MTRILLIEDEDRFRVDCRRALERDGYEVLDAPSAGVGPEQLDLQVPDLVIYDVQGQDPGEGVEVVKSLVNRCPRVPVLVAMDEPESASQSMRDVADAFLRRSAGQRSIRDKVRRLLVPDSY
ncbi:MAG: response regulator [bacterium]|nr:response regulator [bacterium]